MTRQRFEGLRAEMVRRTLVKFDTDKANKMGVTMAKMHNTPINWNKAREDGLNSYEDIWNSDGFKSLRASVGM